jgi:hypothetical protein
MIIKGGRGGNKTRKEILTYGMLRDTLNGMKPLASGMLCDTPSVPAESFEK